VRAAVSAAVGVAVRAAVGAAVGAAMQQRVWQCGSVRQCAWQYVVAHVAVCASSCLMIISAQLISPLNVNQW
jgi:hypothetical protein